MSEQVVGKVSKGSYVVTSFWPPEALRNLAGPLPFDPMEEIKLALVTCQDLDHDVVSQRDPGLMSLARFEPGIAGIVAGLFHAIYRRARFIKDFPAGNLVLISHELQRCEHDSLAGLAMMSRIDPNIDERAYIQQLIYSEAIRRHYVARLATIVNGIGFGGK